MKGLSIKDGKLSLHEEFIVENRVSPRGSTGELTESQGNLVLIPKIEAIHAGVTRNKMNYPSQSLAGNFDLKSGVYSWTHPYPKPVLKNHDTYEEPLGRVINAQFVTDSITGKHAIVLMPQITDPDAIVKIMDGRYLTVSIGGETDAAICNICGQDIISEGWCDHIRGEKYEVKGELVECYWSAGNVWFDEISFVNVPADQSAQVISTGELRSMECFAYDGEHIMDLQKSADTKEFYLGKQRAILEGFHFDTLPRFNNKEDVKGGNSKLNLEQMKEALDKKEAELKEAQDKVKDFTTQVETLTEQVKTLIEKDRDLETKVETLTKEAEASKETVNGLNEQIKDLETNKATLLEENAKLATEIHKSLVERIVDIKCSLNKPGCEDREALIQALSGRNAVSLNDTLQDLLAEFNASTKFVVGKVDNPGLGDKDKQKTATEDTKTNGITLEDVFHGLLTQKYRK